MSTKSQTEILQTEKKKKKSHLRTFQNGFNCLGDYLQFSLNCVNFAHISASFLSSNANLLKTHESIQQKTFDKLLIEWKPKKMLKR